MADYSSNFTYLLVLVGWWTGKLVSFYRPYLYTSGRRRSLTHWLMLHSQRLLVDCSSCSQLSGWRKISLYPVLIFPLLVSYRVLWGYKAFQLMWKTAHSWSFPFQSITCTLQSCPLWVFYPSEMWCLSASVFLNSYISSTLVPSLADFWSLSKTSMSLLKCGDQAWTQNSKCGLDNLFSTCWIFVPSLVWNPSTEYGDIASRERNLNEQWTDGRTDGRTNRTHNVLRHCWWRKHKNVTRLVSLKWISVSVWDVRALVSVWIKWRWRWWCS